MVLVVFCVVNFMGILMETLSFSYFFGVCYGY